MQKAVMRTTLDIEAEVLVQMVSRLLRAALSGAVVIDEQIDPLREEAGL